MFDKIKFSDCLIKLRGSRNNTELANESGVSRAYISGYINQNIPNPPSIQILKQLSNVSYNNITIDNLMEAADYLNTVDTVYESDSNDYYNTDKDILIKGTKILSDEEAEELRRFAERLFPDKFKKD